MVYITSNGTISRGDENKHRPLHSRIIRGFINLKPHWKVVFIAVVAFVCSRWWNPNPLANGRIPAADLEPHQHWNRILKDDFFVRSMTQHLGATTHRKGIQKQMQEIYEGSEIADKTLEIISKGVDFGGPDGHILEKGDWHDLKYVQGTRCSTTRSAVTAYFCGAFVAGNQDQGLEPSQRKRSYLGVQSFAAFLACRHQQGERRRKKNNNGHRNNITDYTHRRSVYRIGIGCQDPLAGYSHAFSIVAQPDGTFFWLQSFVGHYSLQEWMTPSHKWRANGSSSHNAHLTLQELLAKLQQVSRLMKITSWTDQANTDYRELFGVDKAKEAMDVRKVQRALWNPNHRLEYFVWDEACEYPLPAAAAAPPPPPPPPQDAAPSSTTDQQRPSHHVFDRESKVSDDNNDNVDDERTNPQRRPTTTRQVGSTTTGDNDDWECYVQMMPIMIQEHEALLTSKIQ